MTQWQTGTPQRKGYYVGMLRLDLLEIMRYDGVQWYRENLEGEWYAVACRPEKWVEIPRGWQR